MTRRIPLSPAVLAATFVLGCASDEKPAPHQPPVEENRAHAHEMSERMLDAVDDERAEEKETAEAMLEDAQAKDDQP
ncbi:MAG: hypothetical protein H6825_15485 [Planctomycetes bacterium]|nr:hypothetical protein [Planctomycetota bacterium]